MKIVSYSKTNNDINGGGAGGGSGSSGSSEIQNPTGTRGELDRTIWGQTDVGDDIDGTMKVNGDVYIKVIEEKNYEPEDEEDEGDDVEYETGGGSLFVDLKVKAQSFEADEDVSVGRHLYISYPHPSHSANKKCVAEIMKEIEDAIKAEEERAKSAEKQISDAIEAEVTRATGVEDILDQNIQICEQSIRNNADEIVALKNRTTQAETDIANNAMPIGTIVMFSGTMAEIPDGWAICNGENGTPNLIGKFIKAWTTAGQTGGGNSVKLKTSDIPKMQLNYNSSKVAEYKEWTKRLNKQVPTLDKIEEGVYDEGGSTHWALYTGYKEGDNGLLGVNYTTIIDDVVQFTSIGTDSEWQTGVEFEPSYYSLIYIMKVG